MKYIQIYSKPAPNSHGDDDDASTDSAEQVLEESQTGHGRIQKLVSGTHKLGSKAEEGTESSSVTSD